jgi:microcystin-dependent protein
MSDAYTGEIRMFAGNYAPQRWMLCYGQIMAIAGEEALFSLLGSTYGGDGRSSFGIPDMRGRIPLHHGQGPSLTPRLQGQLLGLETVTLDLSQIPPHSHKMQCSTNPASSSDPTQMVLAEVAADRKLYDTTLESSKIVEMENDAIEDAGSDAAHSNMMPVMGLNFIMCRSGIYPQRN